jgi:hypothetical protein
MLIEGEKGGYDASNKPVAQFSVHMLYVDES